MRPGGAEHTGLLNLGLLAEGAFPLGVRSMLGFLQSCLEAVCRRLQQVGSA